MSWIIYALGAISAVAVSDLFRKLGSDLKDPFLSNLIFQLGSFTIAIIMWILFSRKIVNIGHGVLYALIGGFLISVFTALSFKALEIGPGVSTVIPVIRVGGVILVTVLGIIILRDKLTLNLIVGILLAVSGVCLIFSGK